ARFAVSQPGSTTDVLSRVFLKNRNLDPDKDLQIVPIDPNAMAAGLQNGKIDGFIGSPPEPQKVVGDGAVLWPIENAPEYNGMIYSVVVSSTTNLEQKQPMLLGLLKGLARASKYTNNNPESAFAITREANNIADIDKIGGQSAWQDTLRMLKPGPKPTQDGYDKGLKIYQLGSSNPLKNTLEQSFNLTLVDEALK